MISKIIKYNDLGKAISIVFKEDNNLLEFYDPNVIVGSIEDIVKDVLLKIKTYDNPIIKGVFEKNKLIGYYIYINNMLISFGLEKTYRVRKYLKKFFLLLRGDLGKGFICHLWNKNIRAIKWLLKNNMKIIDIYNKITKLQCQ